MAEEILIPVNVDTKGAEKGFDKLEKSTEKSIDRLIGGFKTLAAVAVAAFAGRELLQGMNSAIRAAAEQEQAFQNLSIALKNTGNFSKEAVEGFGKLASELQKTSVFADDVILNQIALAQQFGVTNQQAEKLIRAAVDLSAATGQDLNTSVEQLGKTMSGSIGLLGRSNKELQGLSKAALQSGAAIDILGKKFAGAAAGQIKTFNGATTQLGHTFGDMLEEIGNVIVKNPVIIGAISALTKVIESLTAIIVENQRPITDFVSTLVIMGIKTIPYVIDGIKFLGNAFLFLREIALQFGLVFASVLSGLLEIKAVRAVFKFFFDYFKEQILISISLLSGLLGALAKIPGAGKFLDPIVEKLDGLGGAIAGVAADDALGKVTSGIDKLGVSMAKSLNESDDLFDSFNKNAEKAKSFTEGLIDSVKNFSTESSSAFAGSKGPLQISDELKDKPKDKEEKSPKKVAEEAGISIFEAISKGGQFLADTLSGKFLTEIQSSVELLGGFPKQFSKALTALPETIDKLTQSIPKVLDKLLSKAPALFSRIANFLPLFVTTIIDAFGKIADIIAANAPKLAGAILDGIIALVEAAPMIIDKLAKGLPKLFRVVLQKIPALIGAISRAIPALVRTFAEVLPELIVVLIEEMPNIVQALIEGIITAAPAIVFALVDALILKGGIFKIIVALIKAIPQLIIAIVSGLANGLKGILPGIFGNLGKAFTSGIKFPQLSLPKLGLSENLKDILTGKKFGEAIKKKFDEIIQKIKDALSFKVGGKKNGVGGTIGKVFGGSDGRAFATGGTIPTGFPNDTFPARLTSGEMVVPKDDVSRLSDFLDNQSNGGHGIDVRALAAALAEVINARPMQVSVEIGEQQLATAVFNAKRRGFRI